jgi:hypothetical protein
MTRKSAHLMLVVSMLTLSFVFVTFQSLSATPVPGETPDILLKISDLEKNLNTIDQVFGGGNEQSANNLSTQIRQFLQSTDWIDPDRSMVAGMVLKDPQPTAAVLIPFRKPNEAFQSMYGATLDKDYYLLTLPPGQPVVISSAFETVLNTASRSKSKYFIDLKVGLRQLIAEGEQQMNQVLSQLENMPQNPEMQNMPFSPGDIREMLENMLATARQLETFSLRIDLTKDQLSILSEAQAASGTELAKAFVSATGASILGNFKPSHDLNFRSRSYDYSGFIAVLDKTFGSIYRKMGIDFSEITEIMDHYTGEMAGGVSFSKDSFRFEGIDVLKDPAKANTFIENVYLPWIDKFSQTMADKLGELSGEKFENPFERAETSTVGGYKVYGAKFKMPELPDVATGADMPTPKVLKEFEWRFTTVDRYFIYATDDKALAKMIHQAKNLKPKSVSGPLIAVDLDFGSYLQFIASMVPQSAGSDQPIPKLGRVYITYDFKNGKALSSSTMKMRDVKQMIAFFSKGAYGSVQANLNFDDDQNGDRKKTASEDTSEKKAADAREKAEYWFRKGAMCSTYGNNQAAISYFEKAIAIDPGHSGAYFEQGISHGQLGDYQKAIPLLNKCIAMEPQNGLYYYGRGRVYLLADENEKAIMDFKKAAELGDEDAIKYLEYIGQSQY